MRGAARSALGSAPERARLLEEARSLLSDTKDANELIMVHGALGLARLGLGNRNAAIESASLALRLGSGTRRPTNHATLTGLTAAVEVFVALWRREPREPTWRACATEGVEALQRHRGVFPITEPSFRYWRGWRPCALRKAKTRRRGLATRA